MNEPTACHINVRCLQLNYKIIFQDVFVFRFSSFVSVGYLFQDLSQNTRGCRDCSDCRILIPDFQTSDLFFAGRNGWTHPHELRATGVSQESTTLRSIQKQNFNPVSLNRRTLHSVLRQTSSFVMANCFSAFCHLAFPKQTFDFPVDNLFSPKALPKLHPFPRPRVSDFSRSSEKPWL